MELSLITVKFAFKLVAGSTIRLVSVFVRVLSELELSIVWTVTEPVVPVDNVDVSGILIKASIVSLNININNF